MLSNLVIKLYGLNSILNLVYFSDYQRVIKPYLKAICKFCKKVCKVSPRLPPSCIKFSQPIYQREM